MVARSTVTTEIRRGEDGTPTALVVMVEGHEPMVVRADGLAPAVAHEALMHGLRQKLIDAAALERDSTTGRPASAEDKYNAIRVVFDRITDEHDPQWNGRAEGDGTSGAGLLVRAVMEACGMDVEQAKGAVDGWDKKTQNAMRADATIAPIIKRLKDEQDARKSKEAAKSIDTGALLAKLLPKGEQ